MLKEFLRRPSEKAHKIKFINSQILCVITDSTLEIFSIKSGCLIVTQKCCISLNLAIRSYKKNNVMRSEVYFYNKLEQRIEKMNERSPEILINLLENINSMEED